MADNELLTPKDVAMLLKTSQRTIYRYIGRGELAARRLPGGGIRILRADAEALLRGEAVHA